MTGDHCKGGNVMFRQFAWYICSQVYKSQLQCSGDLFYLELEINGGKISIQWILKYTAQ